MPDAFETRILKIHCFLNYKKSKDKYKDLLLSRKAKQLLLYSKTADTKFEYTRVSLQDKN